MSEYTNTGAATEQATNQHEMTHRSASTSRKVGDVTFRPSLDMYDVVDRYEIQIDLPGATPEDIDVRIENEVLTVTAHAPQRYEDHFSPLHMEYAVGDFRRQVRLGEDIDTEALSATFVDGVLQLTLPKRQESRPRRIEVRPG